MIPVDFKSIYPCDVVAVQGKPYLFTNFRVDRATVPKGFYAYDVQDSDCDGQFRNIQDHAIVNHWGTIIGLEELDLDENGCFECKPDEDEPEYSAEGTYIGFSMKDQAEYVVWYHSLKDYAKAVYSNM